MIMFQLDSVPSRQEKTPGSLPPDLERENKFYYFIKEFEFKGETFDNGAFIELSPKQYNELEEKSRNFDGTIDKRKFYNGAIDLLEKGESRLVKNKNGVNSQMETGDVIETYIWDAYIREGNGKIEKYETPMERYKNYDKMLERQKKLDPKTNVLDCPCIFRLLEPEYLTSREMPKKGAETGKRPGQRMA